MPISLAIGAAISVPASSPGPAGEGPGAQARLVLAPIDEYGSEAMAQAYLSEAFLEQAPGDPAPRAAWLAGRVLLSRLLNQGLLPPLPVAPSGKPLPVSPAMPAFSISHSCGFIAVLLGPDGQSVGCDIERLRPRKGLMDIARHYFSPPEVAHLEQCSARMAGIAKGGVNEQTTAFWKSWTLREAILKQQERSVWDMADIRLWPQPPYSDVHAVQCWHKDGISIACCLTEPAEVVIESLHHRATSGIDPRIV